MDRGSARLGTVKLPGLPRPDVAPELPGSLCSARLERLRECAEWVNSQIHRGSPIELRSGLVLQVDITPATGGPYFTTNIEDGIALTDATLRKTLAKTFPDLWDRVQRRRAFLRDAIGIDLHPPTSCRCPTCRHSSRRSCFGLIAP